MAGYKSLRSGKVGKFMRKNRSWKKRYGTKRVYPKQRTIRSPGLRSAVKSMISRMAENKKAHIVTIGLDLQGTATAATFDNTNIIALGCQTGAYEIEQGVGMSQRIGNKITVKRATIKGTIVANGYNATTNPTPKPVQIKMVLFYNKEEPNVKPTPAQDADFYDFENTTTGFRNDLIDMWDSYNTEKYRIVKTKTFKIGWASSDQFTVGSGTQGTLNMPNNDFKLNANFKIDYTKYLPKTMVFKDNNINSTSKQLYCMWIPCSADGSFIFSGVTRANVCYSCQLQYEDA